MKKILHIITGLTNGGAEGVLYRLCKYDSSATHIVVSLMDEGRYGSLLIKEGVEVFYLNLPAGKVSISALWRLFKFIRSHKPDVVQTWMYHADLIGGVVALLAGVKNVFWNIRQSNFSDESSKQSTITVAKICAILSWFVPKKIICCANEAIAVHSHLGYKNSKMILIGNGYDLSVFAKNQKQREVFRNEIAIESDRVLLGMVGRFDPQKDHFNLLQALEIVKQSFPKFCCVLIGKGLTPDNQFLNEKIYNLGLGRNILLLGQRSDIPSVMNGLDINVLSSAFGEAFPNVLAEAMACGTPCVTTDTGDAGFIIGNSGWLVKPSDCEDLSDAILKAIKEKVNSPQAWSLRQVSARQRIEANFSIQEMINKYHGTWKEG